MARTGKQFIYGIIYLAILAGAGFLIYLFFIKPAPGCTNRVQDKNEEGIDCGGVCGNVCLPSDLRQVTVQSANFFHPTANKLSVLAKIQNANQTLAARSFDYTVHIYDGSGSVIKTISGSNFIYAGEVKYLTEFLDSPQNVSRVDVQIQNPEWVRDSEFSKPQFVIQDRRVESTNTTIQVSGRVANKDVIDIPKVTITAIFYGSETHTPIGTSVTELDNVVVESLRPFSITHPLTPHMDFDPVKTELVVSARRP